LLAKAVCRALQHSDGCPAVYENAQYMLLKRENSESRTSRAKGSPEKTNNLVYKSQRVEQAQ